MRTLKPNLAKAQGRMKALADKKRTDRHYAVRDWVLVKFQPYKMHSLKDHGYQKLSAKCFSPF